MGHQRFTPFRPIGRRKHLNGLAPLDELEMERKSHLAEDFALIVILIARLVPPPADDRAR